MTSAVKVTSSLGSSVGSPFGSQLALKSGSTVGLPFASNHVSKSSSQKELTFETDTGLENRIFNSSKVENIEKQSFLSNSKLPLNLGPGWQTRSQLKNEYAKSSSHVFGRDGRVEFKRTGSRNGVFFSPKFPQNYPPDSRCSYTFLAMERERIAVSFKSVQIESSNLKLVADM